MPDFSRDTNIGYPKAETDVVVKAAPTDGDFTTIIDNQDEHTVELQRLRRGVELILGQEVEPED